MTENEAVALATVIGAVLYFGVNYAPQWLGSNGKLVAMAQRLSKTDEIKSYGGGMQTQQLERPYDFEIVGTRYDEEERHQFHAVRKPDTLMAMRFMGIDDENAGELAPLATLLIGKALDNKDGVPVQWEPNPVPKPRNAGADWEPKFRAPDGKLYPMHQAAKYQEFAAGSSRRRWEALLVDNQFTLEIEVLITIVKDMIEVAVQTPTNG
jgi:hypothetical protein